MSRRRLAREARGAGRITPHSTRRKMPRGPVSTRPYPVAAVPGSTPSTFTRPAPSVRGLGQLARVDIEVGEDLRHVVEVLECIEQLDHLLRLLPLDLHRGLRYHRDLGG